MHLLPPEPEAADPLVPARTLLHLHYRTDPKGRIVAISRYEETAQSTSFHQGEAGTRITTTRYRYDEHGRLTEEEARTLLAATASGEEEGREGPQGPKAAAWLVRYRYDEAGRRLEKEETTLASPGGRAKTPPSASPKTATQVYRYDAQGRRRAG
jgi:plasmid stability protein